MYVICSNLVSEIVFVYYFQYLKMIVSFIRLNQINLSDNWLTNCSSYKLLHNSANRDQVRDWF